MKRIYVFVPIFLVLIIAITSFSNTLKLTDSINEKVLRLHIIANSDSDIDQALKLKVRDGVLKQANELYNSCVDLDEAINITKSNLEKLNIVAKQIVSNEGFCYDTKVTICKEYFNTRYYDDFTLPAGCYNSLKIIIGSGEGHNWWCVLYPSVCISGATDDFNNVLSEEERQAILNQKYIPRFKLVEIYKKIKNNILTI